MFVLFLLEAFVFLTFPVGNKKETLAYNGLTSKIQ